MDRRFLELVALLLFGILLYFSYKTLMPVIDAVIIALVLAYMVRPITKFVEKIIHKESICVLLSMLILIIPLIIVGLIISNEIISSFKSNDISGIIDNAFSNLDAILDSISESIFRSQNGDTDEIGLQILDQISSKFSEFGIQAYEYLFSIAKGIPMLLFNIILAAVLCFYFVRDGIRLKERIVTIVPSQHRERFNNLVKSVDIMVQAVIIGYIFKAIFTGLIAIIVFYSFGISEYLLLGILTGILDFIPLIGPWIVELLLFSWYVYNGDYAFAIGFLTISYIFISFIPEMYIRPRISGSAANVHPVIMLLGAIGGLMAFGAMGIIIGPLLLSITYVVIRIYFNDEPYEQIQFGYRDIFINLFKRG